MSTWPVASHGRTDHGARNAAPTIRRIPVTATHLD
jgi:hypothetical protein